MAAGTPQQVKDAVKKAMGEINDHSNIIWSVGGGMSPDVSNENINAFIKEVNENSKYKQ